MLNIRKDHHDTFPQTDVSTGETAFLEYVTDQCVIRYLSAPLSKGIISKMKWSER
jgi:hypothetical protein